MSKSRPKPGPAYHRMLDAIERAHPALGVRGDPDIVNDMHNAYDIELAERGIHAAEAMANGAADFFLDPPQAFLDDMANW